MTGVAGIDCGTNSLRLLIRDATGREVERRTTIVRLGENVDAARRISAPALSRTRAALLDYVSLMQQHKVERVRMVATSATRDAANRDDFFHLVREVLSVVDPAARIDVITGQEEALLTFTGATSSFPACERALVIDLGGGSTEFALGADEEIIAAHSLDMGCVRLTERYFKAEVSTASGLTAQSIAAATEFIDAMLAELPSALVDNINGIDRVIGVAGTFTTVAALALQLPAYDPELIHLSQLPVGTLKATAENLVRATPEEISAQPVIMPGRHDVIRSGALIVSRVLRWLEAASSLKSITISETDILDGIVNSITSLADE